MKMDSFLVSLGASGSIHVVANTWNTSAMVVDRCNWLCLFVLKLVYCKILSISSTFFRKTRTWSDSHASS